MNSLSSLQLILAAVVFGSAMTLVLFLLFRVWERYAELVTTSDGTVHLDILIPPRLLNWSARSRPRDAGYGFRQILGIRNKQEVEAQVLASREIQQLKSALTTTSRTPRPILTHILYELPEFVLAMLTDEILRTLVNNLTMQQRRRRANSGEILDDLRKTDEVFNRMENFLCLFSVDDEVEKRFVQLRASTVHELIRLFSTYATEQSSQKVRIMALLLDRHALPKDKIHIVDYKHYCAWLAIFNDEQLGSLRQSYRSGEYDRSTVAALFSHGKFARTSDQLLPWAMGEKFLIPASFAERLRNRFIGRLSPDSWKPNPKQQEFFELVDEAANMAPLEEHPLRWKSSFERMTC
jgi:hypothetical protein